MFSLPLLVVVLFQVRQHRPQPYLLNLCARLLLLLQTHCSLHSPSPTNPNIHPIDDVVSIKIATHHSPENLAKDPWFWEVGGCNPREPRACCRILARCRRVHQRERWRTVVLPGCQKREDCLRKVPSRSRSDDHNRALFAHQIALLANVWSGIAARLGRCV